MTQQITLEAAAKVFRVHPRTVVRAMSGVHNTYWTEDINHDMHTLDRLAGAYEGITPDDIKRILEGRDELLKPNEAADLIGVQPRTFRTYVTDRKIRGRVKSGRIVRYLRSKVIDMKWTREAAADSKE
jgi:hypothetical protein